MPHSTRRDKEGLVREEEEEEEEKEEEEEEEEAIPCTRYASEGGFGASEAGQAQNAREQLLRQCSFDVLRNCNGRTKKENSRERKRRPGEESRR